MSSKQLLFDDEALRKLKDGVKVLASAVKVTLGPKGRNAVLDKSYGNPVITKDGLAVAKEIELADPFENIGAKMVKDAASKTNDVAGDGTSTAVVLAESIFLEGLKLVSAAEISATELKRGIDRATVAAVEAINFFF